VGNLSRQGFVEEANDGASRYTIDQRLEQGNTLEPPATALAYLQSTSCSFLGGVRDYDRVSPRSAANSKVTEPPKHMWACSNPLCLFRWDDKGDISTDRQCVSDYIRACESLLKSSDLSDHEQEVVEGMTRRMLEEMFPSGDH